MDFTVLGCHPEDGESPEALALAAHQLRQAPGLPDALRLPLPPDVENDWVRTLADGLATDMKGATQDAGSWAVFSDPRDDFDGKAVCGDPESIHGIVVTGREQADHDAPSPSMRSFHPKPQGLASTQTP
ncbi:RNaseH domain-containing protein [Streptomyces sp. TP-A0356]|uniref:RNaseH domain-containing protein n=1 Tax=Streptomyces sp. TP-A0356 TaxID=1359208 RepID=UPI000AF8DEDF|nr:RNaseH domain-containing protein [Streptomyces sp. TP-A0356]